MVSRWNLQKNKNKRKKVSIGPVREDFKFYERKTSYIAFAIMLFPNNGALFNGVVIE